MKILNSTIYQLANALTSVFDNSDIYIPVKANFFIQKNTGVIAAAAQEIERSRLEVAKKYGVLDEDGQKYTIPQENMQFVTQELNDLFSIEQDLDIKTFSIEALGDAELTTAQMQAIMIMIEE